MMLPKESMMSYKILQLIPVQEKLYAYFYSLAEKKAVQYKVVSLALVELKDRDKSNLVLPIVKSGYEFSLPLQISMQYLGVLNEQEIQQVDVMDIFSRKITESLLIWETIKEENGTTN